MYIRSLTAAIVLGTSLFFSGCGNSSSDNPQQSVEPNPTDENKTVVLTNAMSLNFNSTAVPLTDQDSLSYTKSVSVNSNSDSVSYNQIVKTGYQDNGEIFGAVKDVNGALITFTDGAPYICNGTNSGIGSGLDFSSILQKDGKIYVVSQFECSIGAMYMSELQQDAEGMLTPKPNTLKYIDQSSEFGGWTHCAGSITPWESHLGSEEYESNVKKMEAGNSDKYYTELKRYWGDKFSEVTPYYYGWITETSIDNEQPNYTKHYSMGRLSHEMAYVMPDKKTVYMSDDGSNVGLYMFIADNTEDLTSGTLYGAKFSQISANKGGSFDLTWINLGHATDSEIKTELNSKPKFSDIFESADPLCASTCPEGFTSVNTSAGQECLKVKSGMDIIASRLETRRYSAIKGVTTELNKEEGIDYDPVHNKLYVAITSISKGMEDDNSANDFGGYNDIKLPNNGCGGVYALDLAKDSTTGSDYLAQNFKAIIIGEAKDYSGTDYTGNSCNINGISSPDNLTYLGNTNTLLIAEDTSGHKNNMVWAYDVENQSLARVAALPKGAEATSTGYYQNINNYSYVTLVTQHPSKMGESALGAFKVANSLTTDLNLSSYKEIAYPDYSTPGTNDVVKKSSECYTSGDGIVFATDFECGLIQPWQVYSTASNDDWRVAIHSGKHYAYSSGYGADEPQDDWLISPKLTLSGDEILTFASAKGYSGSDLVVKISKDYIGSGDPTAATWSDLNATYPVTNENGYTSFVSSGDINLSAYKGDAYIAFYTKANGTISKTVANWEVDDVVIKGSGNATVPFQSDFTISSTTALTTDYIEFKGSVSGGTNPYTYLWNLGNGTTKTDESFCYKFTTVGDYNVTLSVTDKTGANADTTPKAVSISAPLDEKVPAKVGDLRVATFNAYLNRASNGELHSDLVAGSDTQIKNVAHIIQLVRPDVILINEFDYNGSENVNLLVNNYLKVAQGDSVTAINYPYTYTASVNTGVQSGLDLNKDGKIDGNDAYGFGEFPGQYGMVVLSMYPIDTANVKTFQKFLWKDMPNAYLPTDANTTTSYYSTEVLNIFRLSSKSHWDLPVNVEGKIIHVLADHPTPPTFDDGDKDGKNGGDDNISIIDKNGLRNHDEIRLWADYVDNNSSYLYDDNKVYGGLAADTRFVILGDHNADPDEGDSYKNAIMQFLNNKFINSSVTPQGAGETTEGVSNRESDDTANWSMRADYVLPSVYGFDINQCGIFWPQQNDIKHYLVEKNDEGENSSDHRLVWCDLNVTDVNSTQGQTVPAAPVSTLFTDFSDASLNPWKNISVTGEQTWYVYEYNNKKFAKMSGYANKASNENEDWLISPAIAFDGTQTLNFDNAVSFTGPTLELKISTDYDGVSNPNTATWNDLTFTKSDKNYNIVNSGNIDLSAYKTTGYIAFKYTSTSSESATWQVYDINVSK